MFGPSLNPRANNTTGRDKMNKKHIEQQLSVSIRALVELRHDHMNTSTEHVYLNMYHSVYRAIDEYKEEIGL